MADIKGRLAEAQKQAADARVRLEEALGRLAEVKGELMAAVTSANAAIEVPEPGEIGPSMPLDLGATPAATQSTGEAELVLDDQFEAVDDKT